MEQFQQLDYVMLILLVSIILSVLLSWFSLRIAPDVGLMDIPGSADHKNHTSSIPLTGGVVLILSLIHI